MKNTYQSTLRLSALSHVRSTMRSRAGETEAEVADAAQTLGEGCGGVGADCSQVIEQTPSSILLDTMRSQVASDHLHADPYLLLIGLGSILSMGAPKTDVVYFSTTGVLRENDLSSGSL